MSAIEDLRRLCDVRYPKSEYWNKTFLEAVKEAMSGVQPVATLCESTIALLTSAELDSFIARCESEKRTGGDVDAGEALSVALELRAARENLAAWREFVRVQNDLMR